MEKSIPSPNFKRLKIVKQPKEEKPIPSVEYIDHLYDKTFLNKYFKNS